MKRRIGEGRKVVFSVYCSEEDLKTIKAFWKKTTSRSLSEYARKVLLAEPVAVTCRNVSIDRLIEMMVTLRSDFERLSERSGFWAKDRNRLVAVMQEMKTLFYKITDECMLK